jgi:hypothetical protein
MTEKTHKIIHTTPWLDGGVGGLNFRYVVVHWKTSPHPFSRHMEVDGGALIYGHYYMLESNAIDDMKKSYAEESKYSKPSAKRKIKSPAKRKAPSKKPTRKVSTRRRSESRVVSAKCKQCGAKITYDIGNHTKEEIIEILKEQDTFNCPGHHVELGSPLRYVEIDWNSVKEQHVPTDKEWLSDMKKKGYKLISTDELRGDYNVTGFSMGICVAVRKSDGEKVYLDFTQSPSGKRYYY